jgi:hypothetical protein
VVPELSDRLKGEFENLRTLRDDLRVRIHLAKAEVRDQWEDLEKDWQRVEGRMKAIGDSSRESAKEVGEAAGLLVEELRDAYRRLRETL